MFRFLVLFIISFLFFFSWNRPTLKPATPPHLAFSSKPGFFFPCHSCLLAFFSRNPCHPHSFNSYRLSFSFDKPPSPPKKTLPLVFFFFQWAMRGPSSLFTEPFFFLCSFREHGTFQARAGWFRFSLDHMGCLSFPHNQPKPVVFFFRSVSQYFFLFFFPLPPAEIKSGFTFLPPPPRDLIMLFHPWPRDRTTPINWTPSFNYDFPPAQTSCPFF